MICKFCDFWERRQSLPDAEQSKHGFCKVNAPVLVNVNSTNPRTSWPSTHENERKCGKFKVCEALAYPENEKKGKSE